MSFYNDVVKKAGTKRSAASVAGGANGGGSASRSSTSRAPSNSFSSSAGSSIAGALNSGSSGGSSSRSTNNNKAINDLYQKNLGRSVDQAGLDYWSKEADQYGLDYVEKAIRDNNEYSLYQNRGVGMTVAKPDQVSGFNYRNSNDIATQEARDPKDYGLLNSGMQAMVETGNYTPEQDAQGNMLYRSRTGGLYDISGMPVEERPTRSVGSAPQTQVTPQQTSQYQLQQMLDSNSPLMQQAATMGSQRANSRGLLNSSMGNQAAQGAMIERATPFAQQDAQTYFQGDQANADRRQQEYMSRLGYEQQLGLNEQGFGFDMGRMQAEYGFSSQLSTQEANQSLQKLKATSSANGWGVMANNLTDIIGQYSSQLERIQMNPDIDEETKTSLIEQVLDMRDADLDFQRSMYDQLPNYLADTGVFPNR